MAYKKGMLPSSGRPKNERAWFEKKLKASIKKFGGETWDGKSLILFGCEAYYQLMGNPNTNDRRIFDDALCVLSGERFMAFNFNLDPNGERPGFGHSSNKGMGTIHYGIHEDAYAIGKHRNLFPALRQVGKITVRRDADVKKVKPSDLIVIDGFAYYLEVGSHQAMNIHPAGATTTSSLGCQTAPRDQWPTFIALVQMELKRLGQKRITYVKDRVRG